MKTSAWLVYLAVKKLREEGVPFTKEIRLVYGSDEERTMEDMKAYVRYAGLPEFAMTPDGNFPMAIGEKGALMWIIRSKYRGAVKKLDAGVQPIAGHNGEPPCPSRLNSGLFAQFRELGDVEAIVTGHDHDCDYVLPYGQMNFIYGRYSGGDTVYNHLGLSGCRVFRFRAGVPGYETWVRLYGGEIEQPLIF
jgi:acetylornithine deacetylase/succinyl-diaminopimelate desuccinylase-like protein